MADIFGTKGTDVINGTESDDVISAGPAGGDPALETGNDEINGLGGHDIIQGLGGDDTLRGGIGEDWIAGGAGDDTIDAGSGTDDEANFLRDRVDYMEDTASGGFQGVTVDLAAQINDIEVIRGTQFDDVVIGGLGDQHFRGLDGAETFDGGGDCDDRWHRIGADQLGLRCGASNGRGADMANPGSPR